MAGWAWKEWAAFFCVWEKRKRNRLVVLQQEVQLVLVGEWVGASAAFQIYQWSVSEELSRKHSPFFKSVCLQAWSEFDTGNRLRSNWDDHFTSSWPVRWLRAVIITKRGEHETSGFSTHHCALHILTCFLFLSACNSWTKKKKASRIYLWCYSSHCVPGQSPDTVTATSSSWLWSFYLATAFMDQHDDTRGEEKRRGAIWDVSRTISATRTLGALFPLKRSVRRGDSLWLWTKLNCWSQKKDKLLHTHKLFLYSDCDYTVHVQIPKSV